MSGSEHDLSIYPPGQHPTDWDPPLMSPSPDIAAWLVGLMADDIATWSPAGGLDARAELRVGFALYLADHLPPDGPRPTIEVPRAVLTAV